MFNMSSAWSPTAPLAVHRVGRQSQDEIGEVQDVRTLVSVRQDTGQCTTR